MGRPQLGVQSLTTKADGGGTVPIFDGHNDTLTKIRHGGPNAQRSFLERSELGHLDLPRAREGGLAGGFFAIFTSSPNYERVVGEVLDADGEVVPGGWSVQLPPKLERRIATSWTVSAMSNLFRLEAESQGEIEVVRSVADLRRCLADGTFAVIIHIEGAESIDRDLEALDVFYEAGLRSLGPVWSRPTIFGHGVPFDFPGSPDTGPGLTAAGRRLVKRCNELGVLIDLSHLNAKGFWDVAGLSDAPLVATHSCAWTLSATPRNLTDEQLDAVGDSRGVVGINYAVGFLRADGNGSGKVVTPLTEIVRHARYVVDRIGIDHVALGSDFDGARVPDDLEDASGLPRLIQAFRDAGFEQKEIEQIAYRNWVRVLEQTWRA
jgi:membrane dipeptidase